MITGDKNMNRSKQRMVTLPGCTVKMTADPFREHVSLAAFVTISTVSDRNAKVSAPLVLYSGKRTMDYMIRDVVHNGLGKATANGCMDSITFQEYLQHMVEKVKYIQSGDGILLDGHSSHFSLETLKYCQEHNLHLIRMPSHCTHVLQPMDVSLFNIFKGKLLARYTHLYGRVTDLNFTLKDINDLIAEPFQQTFFSYENIQRAFAKSGIALFGKDSDPVSAEIVKERQVIVSSLF